MTELAANKIIGFTRCVDPASAAPLEALREQAMAIPHDAVTGRYFSHFCTRLVNSRYLDEQRETEPTLGAWNTRATSAFAQASLECPTVSQPIATTLVNLALRRKLIVADVVSPYLGQEITSLYRAMGSEPPQRFASIALMPLYNYQLSVFKRTHFTQFRKSAQAMRGQEIILRPLATISPGHWQT